MTALIEFLLRFSKAVKTADDETGITVVKKCLFGRWYEVKHYVNPPQSEPDTRWHKTVD
jgi:hypothetical protein